MPNLNLHENVGRSPIALSISNENPYYYTP